MIRQLLLGTAMLGVFSFSMNPAHAATATCTPKLAASHLVAAGKFQMAINPTLPPQQFVDDKGQLQGLNVELGRAIAEKLCLEPVFVRMDMPPMIPGLRTGQFDAINTGLFWTEERSKMLYMVPYGQQALSIYTLPGSTFQPKSFADLAGHSVGVELSTYQERKAREVNAKLVADGKPSIDFRTFTTVTDTSAALRARQLEAGINIDETATSLADRGIVKIWTHGLEGTDITFAMRDKVTAEAVAQALAELKSDGTYDKLFSKFHMTPLKTASFGIRGPGPQ
jgi:polar amino acid transport system substrate-binding protein